MKISTVVRYIKVQNNTGIMVVQQKYKNKSLGSVCDIIQRFWLRLYRWSIVHYNQKTLKTKSRYSVLGRYSVPSFFLTSATKNVSHLQRATGSVQISRSGGYRT